MRPKDDGKESQLKKYEFHKKANGTLNYYLEQGNLIGAYVIAYSLLEDRVRAMYVVVQRDFHNVVITEDDIKSSFARLVDYLKKNNHLSKDLSKELHKANSNRNKLIHDAMWQIDAIKQEDIANVKKLKNEVSKVLEKLKKNKSYKTKGGVS